MYPYTKKFSKNIFFIAFIFLKNNSLYLNKIRCIQKFLNLIFSKIMVWMKKLFFFFDFCIDKNSLYLSSYHVLSNIKFSLILNINEILFYIFRKYLKLFIFFYIIIKI